MLNSAATNDEEFENTQVIAKIFSYLDPADLREARLLNFEFNRVIITHPNLFWAQHKFRIRIRSCDTDTQFKKEWVQLRLNKLVVDYNCPNFHFVKTDLLTPGAVEFFQSTVRYQIKYLELTKCHVTCKLLTHILACVGRKLEHLEIRDCSKFEPDTASSEEFVPESRSIPYLFFPCLTTLILSGELSSKSSSSNTSLDKSLTLELPRNFLHIILHGSCKLQTICLLEWNARTCQRFTKTLGSIDPGKLLDVHTLEIACTTEQDLGTKQQYGLLKPVGWIYVPNLRKLRISFDNEFGSQREMCSEGIEQFIETISSSVATLIEGATDSIESIELINCPVSNDVFRAGIDSFKNLWHINTRGSIVSRLDNEANSVYENAVVSSNLRPQMIASSRSEFTSTEEAEITNANANVTRRRSANLKRTEIYKIICATFVIVAIIHMGSQWAVGGSYLSDKLEILIYSIIVFWITRGGDIAKKWKSRQLEHYEM